MYGKRSITLVVTWSVGVTTLRYLTLLKMLETAYILVSAFPGPSLLLENKSENFLFLESSAALC